MDEFMAIWGQWLKPSAGLPTVQWSLLLAFAAAAGHLVQRYIALPKVVGYSAVGAVAGLAGFPGGAWPLQGIGLFLLELGVSVVLFEAGGRIALRWFRHNPMVLLQSVLEAALTYAAVYLVLRWLGVKPSVADAVALVAIVASPAVLGQVTQDTRAAGPVTERATTLTTLGALYALTLVAARAGLMNREETDLLALLSPVAVVLGLSVAVGAGLALVLRVALRVMNPTSENTSILLITTIAAVTALASHLGGSAPLAALLAGLLLKQVSQRPWAWPRQLGTAASVLVMLSFVLVSVVAAQAEWNPGVVGFVLALIGARALAKVLGLLLANPGSGTSAKQAMLVGVAMTPLSSLALLLTSQFAAASPSLGPRISSIVLPAILLMEVLGAILATFVIHRARESSLPDPRGGAAPPGAVRA
ncbi:cation:proton antiporter domain-containing protein [Ramlibacter humi]|uniref:Sodium:proton exchanger n=1 Tax=Ramlibacter humi TaxID=2530451 RepID=A0A4Z0BQX7_9BURK|nr:cation:proton antiporter [Ramlibacter humi]TFZ01726.1 sodium:proton exchanger [Ramlibacter humi]